MKVIYYNLDHQVPTGGVKVIYDHVELLRRNGVDAYVLHHRQGFRPAWLERDVPILYSSAGIKLSPQDIVVFPEALPRVIERYRGANFRKFVFCQNHYYIFNQLAEDAGLNWSAAGVEQVFSVSGVISRFLARVGWPETPVVHCAVDDALFQPREKRLRIAFMPQKRPEEARFIRHLFRQRYPEHQDLAWAPIAGLAEPAVARVMGESAIFLALNRMEGFGLPPLEAMACGAVVVGFHGDGGREYARQENGLWCAEGDLLGCTEKLAQAAQWIKSGSATAANLLRAGHETAAHFSRTGQEQELLAFWRPRLAA